MSKQKFTILIVDDEKNVLKSLKRLFIDADYKILTAEGGDEGLKLFDNNQIHLVISDYRMPKMNGVRFLSKVKESHPETIRIVLSGYADVAAIVEAINDGHIYKFLAKPWNDQELLTTIKRSLEHYNLQKENLKLVSELQKANVELKELTKSLEEKVNERTRDLEQKNRALEIAQKILNLLPMGVVGVDSEDMIVYLNQASLRFIGSNRVALCASAKDVFDNNIRKTITNAINTQKTSYHLYEKGESIGVICSPLPNQAGVVTILGYTDIEKYSKESDNKSVNLEAENVK